MIGSDRLHRWLALGANVGILIGLVLVIVQIRQSTQLARSTYRSQGNDVANQVYGNLLGGHGGDVIEKSVECPHELTYGDFMALDAFLFTGINMFFRDYQLAEEGLYSEADWQQSVDLYVHWYLGNPFGRAWWDEEGKVFFPEDFGAYVSKQLNENPGRDSHAHWLAIRARVTDEERSGRPSVCKSREAAPPDPRTD